MHILIVEDQDKRFYSIIKRLNQFLKALDKNNLLIVKNNYNDALQYFKDNEQKIDLVLLDVRMPNGEDPLNVDDTNTGIKLYNEIKKVKEKQKVLFWTILKRDELEEKGVSIDENDYIEKTADYIRFFSKIDNKIGTNMSEQLDSMLFSD